MNISKEEIERIKHRMEKQRLYFERLGELPEVKLQGLIFKSWVALGSLSYAEIKDNEGLVWCPIHHKLEKITLECGLSVNDAINKLADQISEHSKQVKEASKKVKLELGMT